MPERVNEAMSLALTPGPLTGISTSLLRVSAAITDAEFFKRKTYERN